jgi:hypothetical protein
MDGEIAIVEGCEVRFDQYEFAPYLHISLRLPMSRTEDREDGVVDQDQHAMLIGHAILEQSRMYMALTRDQTAP